MRCLDLFSGGGGASTGLRRAGFEHLACVDSDPDAVAVARALGLPARTARVEDLTFRNASGGVIDLVWASPPCQSFSTAGKRLGASDKRDGFPALWIALDRMRVAGVGPTWLIVENVPGLLSHRAAAGCDRVASAPSACPGCYFHGAILPELRRRFPVVEHRVIDAASLGVPQRRRRVFVVCGPAVIEWPEPTHADPRCGDCDGVGAYDTPLLGPRACAGCAGTGASEDVRSGKLARWSSVRDALGGLLAVVGGGRHPPADREHERSVRDLTYGPGTTIPAGHHASNGPWVVGDGNEPSSRARRARLRSALPQSRCVQPTDVPADTLSAGTPSGSHRAPLVEMVGGNRGRAREVGGEPRGPLVAGIDRPAWTVDGTPGGLRVEREDPSRGREPWDLDSPGPSPRAQRPGGGIRITESRTGRPRLEYPVTQSAGRGPSDDWKRHELQTPDLPATSVRTGKPEYLIRDPSLLDAPSPAVLASEEKGARHMGNATPGRTPMRASDALWRATGIRRLTVGECAKLQAWPELGEYGDSAAPISAARTKSAAYKVVGNAVPPTVTEALGRAVVEAEASLVAADPPTVVALGQ